MTKAEANQRIDHVIVSRLGNRTRSQIQRLIKQGRAQVSDKTARSNTIVRMDDIITLNIPAPIPAKPKAQSLPVNILYDDVDLVVVDKPAGMVVHPAAGHTDGTLVNALLHHVGNLSGVGGVLRPGIVHRLDRGTSGVMVIAKHDRSHTELARQFKEREVTKHYEVLVWGVVQSGRRIDLPVGRDPIERKKISTRSHRARTALTRINRAEQLHGASFLEVSIETGRTHQIRVHLSAIKHPVVGDALYGGVRRHPIPSMRSVQRLERPFLHAAHLRFRHPSDGRLVEFRSPLPGDLNSVLEALRAETMKESVNNYNKN